MLSAILKTAFRRFHRQRGYFLINVFGLAIGMVCCLLIALWVRDELSYDRWIRDEANVYRATVLRVFPNGTTNSAATPRPLAAALGREFPEITHATRISRERADRVLVTAGDTRLGENNFFFADPNVFDVLNFRLSEGSGRDVLAGMLSIVISESAAMRYFGTKDVVGRTVSVRLAGTADFVEYTVTGVMGDPPIRSHIHPSFLATYRGHPLVGDEDDGRNWGGLNLYTYVRVADGANPDAMVRRMPSVVRKYMAPIVEQDLGISYDEFEGAGNRFVYDLQRLSDIHLTSGLANEAATTVPMLYILLFSTVALLVLLVAGFNFVNLATANVLDRHREIGVRKALGSSRSQLVRLVLTESLLISLIAGLVAAGTAYSLIPVFEHLSGKTLTISNWADPLLLLAALVFAATTGLFAGFYPALRLSKVDPSRSLKGVSSEAPVGRISVRSALVVIQFSVAIVLVISTLVMNDQMTYTTSRPLGYDRENVVLIDGTEVLRQRIQAFKSALQGHPNVFSVTSTQSVPGESLDETDVRLEGSPEESAVAVSWMTTNPGFIETMGISLVDGRAFDPEVSGDSMSAILNETAAEALGLERPIGAGLIYEDRRYEIIGLASDFNFASLHKPIGPLVLFGPDPFNEARPNLKVAVRIGEADLKQTLGFLRQTWTSFAPLQPIQYSFLDEVVDRAYRSDRKTTDLMRVFACLAILIASMGLVGLASLMAKRRTKEIGIRRALGASVASVVSMLSVGFLRLVLVAFLVATPAAYVGMRLWLENFAYRIEISPAVFVLAGLGAAAMAVVSVGYQSVRAGLSDPVESLRQE